MSNCKQESHCIKLKQPQFPLIKPGICCYKMSNKYKWQQIQKLRLHAFLQCGFHGFKYKQQESLKPKPKIDDVVKHTK